MKLEQYSKKHKHYYSNEIPFFIEDIFKKGNIDSVADLGSGDGAILYALFENNYLDDAKKVIAVDASKERINNVKSINSNIECIVSDVCNLAGLKDDYLDLAISSQVIEHVDCEESFIKEVDRILKKDGIFYLSTVFKKWYGWYFYRCNGRWRLDPTHLREYSDKKGLLGLLEKYKFKVLEDKLSLQWFPVSDFIFKRLGFNRDVYKSKLARMLRNIKIPILGYYNWELVLKKNN